MFLIDRPGLTQATVALGEVGVTLMDPDHYALDVLNDILNSFGGKLFDEIRSREVRCPAQQVNRRLCLSADHDAHIAPGLLQNSL